MNHWILAPAVNRQVFEYIFRRIICLRFAEIFSYQAKNLATGQVNSDFTKPIIATTPKGIRLRDPRVEIGVKKTEIHFTAHHSISKDEAV